MKLNWRDATEADLGLLAEWNHQLIRDEGHRNPMTVAQLSERMQAWLRGEYRAVVFMVETGPVAYALYKQETESIYLRQLFVRRDLRRAGIGHAAMAILRQEIWPHDIRLTVEVLCANHAAVAFWRSVGYRDYSLLLEIMPE
jgi:GNAT superfamily N-acetyltransferase